MGCNLGLGVLCAVEIMTILCGVHVSSVKKFPSVGEFYLGSPALALVYKETPPVQIALHTQPGNLTHESSVIGPGKFAFSLVFLSLRRPIEERQRAVCSAGVRRAGHRAMNRDSCNLGKRWC